jgi:hypothetical protein
MHGHMTLKGYRYIFGMRHIHEHSSVHVPNQRLTSSTLLFGNLFANLSNLRSIILMNYGLVFWIEAL